jgi:microcystin-dependent protein
MSNPYIGEIRMFAGNFAPAGWAMCDGQLMPISENDALFTLLGTTYGGDGQETFAVPDLQGRVPIHMGQGSGLSSYVIGEKAGIETVTLTAQTIPTHTHPALCSTGSGSNTSNPAGGTWSVADTASYSATLPRGGFMGTSAINSTPAGGSQPHENMAPFLCVNFIISLFGIFPPPS